MKSKITLLAGLFVAVALCRPAEAHLVQTGFGAYYDGIVHYFMSPADVLAALAMALLGGARGARASRIVVVVLPLAWLAGGAVALISGASEGLDAISPLTIGVVGVLVALNLNIPARAVGVLAALVGAIHGFGNGATVEVAGLSLLALTGATSVVFVLVTLSSAYVVSLEREWARIAVRVAGSWIAAIGMLMLGWHFRPNP